jgi:hypothetical protein
MVRAVSCSWGRHDPRRCTRNGLGFRGASRYYDERYRDGFALECRAMRKVREEMGLENVKLMVPFCRTVEEGRRVIAEMAVHGLVQGACGLEIYVMCEIPSNVIPGLPLLWAESHSRGWKYFVFSIPDVSEPSS